MYIDSLRLYNYRNYENETVQLTNGMNVMVGENGEGKTNLLEAVYLLSTTRSHRSDDDRDLIYFDKEYASVEAVVRNGNDVGEKLTVILQKNGKSLLVNKNPIRKNSEFIGIVNAVLFSPSDMDLFDASPKERRKLIDLELGKLSTNYMSNLSLYLKYLKERNAYLKTNIDEVMLETYTELLLEPEIAVIQSRQKFIEAINSYISYYFSQMYGEQHEVKMVYNAMIEEREKPDLMKAELIDQYESFKERDIYYRQSNLGVHREDYEFFLDGREVRKYCSQGQKRLVLLALKLSIVQIIYQIKREYPILLLDDVFSELDMTRRLRLLKLLPNSVQTIITTTDGQELSLLNNHSVNVLRIKKGSVVDGK